MMKDILFFVNPIKLIYIVSKIQHTTKSINDASPDYKSNDHETYNNETYNHETYDPDTYNHCPSQLSQKLGILPTNLWLLWFETSRYCNNSL